MGGNSEFLVTLVDMIFIGKARITGKKLPINIRYAYEG